MEYNHDATTTAKYFADLIQEKPIRFGYAEGKGKALFAAKRLLPGQPIFSEMPFVAMQHLSNQSLVQGCENCYAVCGSIESQLAYILHVESGAIPPVPRTVKVDIEESLPQKGIVKCSCGAVYCSNECRVAAWERYHCLLCVGHPDTPMQDFVRHSSETNEIFLLAAQVICTICVSFARSRNLPEARKPVDMFCKLPWWEVVSTAADLEPGQTLEEYCGIFKDLLSHTVELFVRGLQFNINHLMLHGSHPDAESTYMENIDFENVFVDCEADGILSVDFFARVVGMFEMNNISLEIRHPCSLVAEMYEDSDNPEIKSWLPTVSDNIQAKLKLEANEEDEEDNEEGSEQQWEYPYLEGTALYSLICMMNHSCEPNVAVSYEYGVATAVALQDISVGDELCISYIETDQDVDARRAELSEYQFECNCPRCESES
ncbi:hypothetical protein LEN26_016125 [Aphanomyces euteiches]|nr:hypothetical protein LEN26_016125 [Aphanomyces euteiches]KAH9103120.1 hypothetical protein AeMF1_020466 [Aphanomyces euteiches]